MSIRENLQKLRREIPDGVKLVAVSKTKSVKEIMEAYDAGQKVFGENKVQELVNKQLVLPKDIEWHFIGHLQTNKVRQIVSFIHYIHSIDSLKLLVEINKEAQKNERVINCLLQFHIASEETKFGLDEGSVRPLLNSNEFPEMRNIRIAGVMGMATFCTETEIIRNEFRKLKKIFDSIKQEYFRNSQEFREISMGMSGDYKIAIEEGSTMVRIGTAVFGDRSVN
jgi:pyridoxal phosphate enzyme (YggS family)